MQLSFGAGFCFGVRTDIANATPVALGIMQDISIAISGDFMAAGSSPRRSRVAKSRSKARPNSPASTGAYLTICSGVRP